MAIYSPSEIREILEKLSQLPQNEPKFKKFERLGVLINSRESDEEPEAFDDNNESQLYACSVCRKKLISAHLLDLHVLEQHDTYFQLQKEKKPMFACYLEECKIKSSNPEERKDHCIIAHKFPHDFRFDKVKPVKPATRKKSPSNDLKMDVSEVTTVPPTQPRLMNFHFGHKTQKVFSTKSKKSNPLETMNVDMKESLPEI